MSNRVAELEIELTRLRADQQAERRTNLIEQLATVRAALQSETKKYRAVAARVKAERAERDRVQNSISGLVNALSQSWESRPAVASFLPGDEEVVAWRTQHEALEAERDRLIALRDSLPQTHLSEYVHFEGFNGLLANLQRKEASILAVLDGTDSFKGGMFAV